MILAKFLSTEDETIFGFEISGHSRYRARGKDIVCASVSSCSYMVANTVTEIYKIDAEIDVEQERGFLSLSIPISRADELQPLFEGFRLHLEALSEEYRKYLKVENETIHK